MSTSLPAGFKDFPVSRYAIYAVFGLPLVASLTSTKYVFYYNYDPFISSYRQFWRLLTFQLGFINESEVFLASILLYQFRNLERLYSSHKYLSLIVVLYFYTFVIVTLLAMLKFYTGMTWFNEVASGPVTILFALLANYREFIPVIYKFEIYGSREHKITLTDQFLVFLLAFQLSISQGWQSVSMAFIGWALGDLIQRRFLPGKNWRVPLWPRGKEIRREETPIPGAEQDNDDDDDDATETRPLASQFLDTFRR